MEGMKKSSATMKKVGCRICLIRIAYSVHHNYSSNKKIGRKRTQSRCNLPNLKWPSGEG